jgi:ORF6N domain
MSSRTGESEARQLRAVRIFLFRGQRVILSLDLAELYGVEAKALVPAVKRNVDRFPEDFMFQLSNEEFKSLKSQFVTSSWGIRRFNPYAFTGQGVTMLSSVLRSKRAVHVNISIVSAFVRLREMLAGHRDLAQKLDELEGKYYAQFKIVLEAIRKLLVPPPSETRKQIGFRINENKL